ncbi:uncharacterized protein A4U43_C06F9680 [Asparagus officinalis]|uniref:Uncharacterized protein n=1 Tax=Asparagus officinalis TaxID=4686 RepID=A0A5P1ELP9_ASPOF|nr:uncharacterized protein A4U43_C06F9680 [Asparagus officinalis]
MGVGGSGAGKRIGGRLSDSCGRQDSSAAVAKAAAYGGWSRRDMGMAPRAKVSVSKKWGRNASSSTAAEVAATSGAGDDARAQEGVPNIEG